MRPVCKFPRSIRSKLYFLLLSVLVPLVAVEAAHHYGEFRSRRSNEFQTNLEVGRALAIAFEEFVRRIAQQELAVGLHLTYPQPPSPEQMVEILRKNNAELPAVRNLAWVTPAGRYIACSMWENLDLDVSDRSYFKDIVSGREWVATGIFTTKWVHDPVFCIARGIRDDAGELLGMVCAFVRPEGLSETLGIERMGGRSFMLMDGNARLVYHYPQVDMSWEGRNPPRDHPTVRAAMAGGEITGIFPCIPTGVERMMAVTSIDSIGWKVFVGRPVDAVMGPIKLQLLRHAGLLLFVSLAVFVAALAVSRNITKPIVELRDHVLRYRQRDSDHPIEIEGSAELQDLADAFNAMAVEINNREKALMESNDKYRLLFEHAPLGIFHFDEDGTITTCNDNFARILGTSKERLIGFSLLASLEDEQAKQAVSDCLAGRIGRFEGGYCPVTGGRISHIRSVWGPVISRDGAFLGGIAVIEDISEHKESEAKLHRSEQRFRMLAENALVGILIVRDGRVIYHNPEMERIYGRIPETMEDENCRIHDDDIRKFRKCCRDIVSRSSRVSSFEIRINSSEAKEDHSCKWIHGRGSLIEYDTGAAVLFNVVDITRLKELEQLLRIKDKMTSLGHVAAGIAHEIRNPLTGINSYLCALKRMMDSETLEEASAREVLEEIGKASNRIESVIRRVMDFSRQGLPAFDPIDLNGCIEEAIKLSSTTLKQYGVSLDLKLSPNLPECYADRVLMEQVFMNLIGNAIQVFKNRNGEKIIRIITSCADDRISIGVSDSGPGIPAEIREKVFDPFFTTRHDGLGIGLSITQRIIAEHGGSINIAESRLGGAGFIIHLPRSNKELL